MLFNQHPEIVGKHAFLSPSSSHWLRYDEQKLEARFYAAQSARRGTDLHAFAHEAIRLGQKLTASNGSIAAYVRDGIGYKMSCEQPLVYSRNCFGTADTIAFRRSKLRIHDLKTGVTRTTVEQLEVYAGLFCLEYAVSPFDIEIELRIYQRDEMRDYFPAPEHIFNIMDTIIAHDLQLETIREER